jgi:hypothetical protein
MSQPIKLILILISVFGLSSCGQKKVLKKISDTYKPIYTDSILCNRLEYAYKQNSQDSLRLFFADWNQNIEPSSKDFIEQNDTIKAVYDSYKAFYNPLDLLKLGDWEWGNDLNSMCKYIVVQNKIFYAVCSSNNFNDFDWETSRKDSICNFRPPLQIEQSKVLYLTTEYKKSIYHFLGTESTKVGTPNLMSPSRSKGESEKRYKQIRSFIPILHGHWGGYWHLETHPYVFTILFNKDLKIAKFDYRVGYQGGEATLTKGTNGWTIQKSEATWIE